MKILLLKLISDITISDITDDQLTNKNFIIRRIPVINNVTLFYDTSHNNEQNLLLH